MATSLHKVAACLSSLDRKSEARLYYDRAVTMFQKTLPAGHPRLLSAQIGLGRTFLDLEEYAEAETVLLDLAQTTASPTASAKRRRESRRLLVKLYELWGKPEKAAAWRAKLEVIEKKE